MDTNQHITATESTLITLCDESELKQKACVLLKAQSGENEADRLYYLILRTTPLHQLMVHYTKRIGVSFNSLRFLYKGKAIIPDHSPHDLKMQDKDSIDVIRRDGYAVAAGTESTLISLPREEGERPICLQLQCDDRKNLYYLIGRNSPLENLSLDYADRILELHDYISLVFDQSRIDLKKTADDLGLDDGDIVTLVVTRPMKILRV